MKGCVQSLNYFNAFLHYFLSEQKFSEFLGIIKFQTLPIEVNSFSRIRTKIWNEMPVSFRKLPKNAFLKEENKTNTFRGRATAAEDYYIDLPEIFQVESCLQGLFKRP